MSLSSINEVQPLHRFTFMLLRVAIAVGTTCACTHSGCDGLWRDLGI